MSAATRARAPSGVTWDGIRGFDPDMVAEGFYGHFSLRAPVKTGKVL